MKRWSGGDGRSGEDMTESTVLLDKDSAEVVSAPTPGEIVALPETLSSEV